MFLTLMVVGLAGLATMTIPWFGKHGHGHTHAGHAHGGVWKASPLHFVPSPRAVFSVLALYGAFGNALMGAAHLTLAIASAAALVPTFLVEYFAVRPLWNALLSSAGEASAPLAELICEEATAVTAFRNGRGMISIVREGRLVQFAAQLRADQQAQPVRVGERLRVEEIDSKRERFTVSLMRGD